MTATEYSGLVTAGKLPPSVSQQISRALAGLEGQRVVVSIREQKKQRSGNQNRYYWGVVIPPIVAVFREHGNNVDADDVHAYLKEHVGKLQQVLVTPHGEVLTGPGSTAKLGTLEFEAYMEKVRAWAAETLDVPIPLPNEQVS